MNWSRYLHRSMMMAVWQHRVDDRKDRSKAGTMRFAQRSSRRGGMRGKSIAVRPMPARNGGLWREQARATQSEDTLLVVVVKGNLKRRCWTLPTSERHYRHTIHERITSLCLLTLKR